MSPNKIVYVKTKENIFQKIRYFFFPKEGWGKAFQNGLAEGKEQGKARAKQFYAKKAKK